MKKDHYLKFGFVLSLLAFGFAFEHQSSNASAAIDARKLLTVAAHNTNTVRTLVHTETISQSGPQGKLTIVTRGEEDEVRNRERDQESVVLVAKAPNGKSRTVRYTMEVVFVAGRTYYRSSLTKNKWISQKGTTLADRVSGIIYKRARTTISVSRTLKYSVISESASIVHVQSHPTNNGVRGTTNSWVSNGAHPYVTHVVYDANPTAGGKQVKVRRDSVYGPFNQTLLIEPPSSSTATGTT